MVAGPKFLRRIEKNKGEDEVVYGPREKIERE
jgi:hypothetical protein